MASETDLIIKVMARGASPAQAFGFVANAIQESGLNPGINEINPTVKGSRGGFGIVQHTGPRRVALERFAQQQGKSASDLDTQLDFIFNVEFPTTESRAASSFFSAKTPEEAALAISRDFLRPGKPNNDARVNNANRLSQEFNGGPTSGLNGLTPPDPTGQQEQAPIEQVSNPFLLDPKDFQRQNNAFTSQLSRQDIDVLTNTNFLTRSL